MTAATRIELVVPWNDLQLAGTLHLPDGEPPYPAVLMLQGSGPADRNNDVYFPPVRDYLVERGLAVYSFDKPGVGESTGNWLEYGFEDRAQQAIAVLDTLRSHSQIDEDRVGVWGHSQGGWIVQIVASRLPELPFAVANSGPSINGELQDLYGCEHSMRAAGHSEPNIEKALGFLKEVHEAARRGEEYAHLETRLLADAREHPWYGYLTLDDADAWTLIGKFVRENYEPVEALSKIRCPFLAIFGALDPLVPAWRCAEESGKALHKAGNQDATIVVFPAGNHRMQDTDGNLITGYLELLGDWLARRAGIEDR